MSVVINGDKASWRHSSWPRVLLGGCTLLLDLLLDDVVTDGPDRVERPLKVAARVRIPLGLPISVLVRALLGECSSLLSGELPIWGPIGTAGGRAVRMGRDPVMQRVHAEACLPSSPGLWTMADDLDDALGELSAAARD